jgi:hypothetical protein
MKLNLVVSSLTAIGVIGISSVSIAHEISANHTSAGDTHNNDRHRYTGNYFGFPYRPYEVSYYDADYCYTPTAEQLAAAQEQVEDYLLAAKKHRKHEHVTGRRYISVETLRPTKKQLEDYTKRWSGKKFPIEPQGTAPSRHPGDPSKLRCLMVYDTQTKQFVGSGCYLVNNEPSVGDVMMFQTVSAEFVGQNSL